MFLCCYSNKNISYLDVNSFHHYKILTEKNFFFHSSSGFDFSLPSSDGEGDEDINDYDKNNNATTILKQELDKWKNFSFILRKQNRKLFEKMLQSSYKYADAINAKGKNFLQTHY